MVVTIDLNVLLDLFLKRNGYGAALELLTLCKDGEVIGCMPSHGLPTVYYILRKKVGNDKALEAISYLLDFLDVTPVGKEILLNARNINLADYEDAIIVASA